MLIRNWILDVWTFVPDRGRKAVACMGGYRAVYDILHGTHDFSEARGRLPVHLQDRMSSWA